MSSPMKSAARTAAAISHPRSAGLGTAMAPRTFGNGGGAVGSGGGGMAEKGVRWTACRQSSATTLRRTLAAG